MEEIDIVQRYGSQNESGPIGYAFKYVIEDRTELEPKSVDTHINWLNDNNIDARYRFTSIRYHDKDKSITKYIDYHNFYFKTKLDKLSFILVWG